MDPLRGGALAHQIQLLALPDTRYLIGSMNGAMMDMVTTMSKLLVLGVPLKEVIRESTDNPAKEIKHPELDHCLICYDSRHTSQSIYLPYNLAFCHTSHSRIAGHLSNSAHIHGDHKYF